MDILLQDKNSAFQDVVGEDHKIYELKMKC